MKKVLLVLFFAVALLFVASCKEQSQGSKPQGEPSVHYDVTSEQWNNEIKNYGFAKGENTKYQITIYSSILDEENLEPDIILYKDGLVFEINNIASSGTFVTYLDFSGDKFEGYYHYGIDHDKFFKRSEEVTIDYMMSEFSPYLVCEFNTAKYENNKYTASIDVDGVTGVASYKFINSRLSEFSLYVDSELYYKMTVEPVSRDIILPNVNYLDEMPYTEMATYVSELLRELASYGAVSDYEVKAYDHYTLATFEYKRLQNIDDSYKTLEEIKADIKRLIIDYEFSKYEDIYDQLESLDDYIWYGQFKEGNKDGLIIKRLPEYDRFKVLFAVVDKDILDISILKEYLEPRFLEEDDDFRLDDELYIETKDYLVVKYARRISGEFETLVNLAITCLEDWGYEWNSQGSGSDYHYGIYDNGSKAVRFNFISDDEDSYILEFTFCVVYNDDEPSDIIQYGVDSPLFN